MVQQVQNHQPRTDRQDPKYAAQFPNGTPICIPIFALNSLSRHNLGVISRTDSDLAIFHLLEEKKRKRDADKTPTPDASKNNIVLEEDDVVSVATAFNALQILLSEVENEVEELPSKNSLNPELSKRNRFPCPSPSPMRNRIIDQGSSTTSPSKLSKSEFEILLTTLAGTLIQSLQPQYTNGSWSLHSFDPKLPLAKDLPQANMKGVVLDLRFLPGFPMSPPF
jgi:ubiquitin-conjugating enzyme E2 Q